MLFTLLLSINWSSTSPSPGSTSSADRNFNYIENVKYCQSSHDIVFVGTSFAFSSPQRRLRQQVLRVRVLRLIDRYNLIFVFSSYHLDDSNDDDVNFDDINIGHHHHNINELIIVN